MKKLLTLLVALGLVFTLTACADYAANTQNTECTPEIIEKEVIKEVEVCNQETTTPVDEKKERKYDPSTNEPGVYYVKHIAGHGAEIESPVYVLHSFSTRKWTKYQITFTSCTWRPEEKNYKQVAYVELNKNGSIRFISFDKDSDGNYTPAVWGDSSPIPPYGDESKRSTGKTKEDFMADFINGFLMNKTVEELADINTIDDMDFPNVDTYAGSSVSVNNIFRAIQGLQRYHLSE